MMITNSFGTSVIVSVFSMTIPITVSMSLMDSMRQPLAISILLIPLSLMKVTRLQPDLTMRFIRTMQTTAVILKAI